ncbi:hypothetical protein OPT61_g2181 [Boeremia exigua]|uniref:Uncharacterized protein n=1 Tax=Boeremia exigua TaxID=749465 RepID=A0ACC2IME2_9PLEO|nr:hypothetical protein OPT61_g2181 [Boeremia exigua]
MASPRRPNVAINNNETVYFSLDAVDQTLFNGLDNKTRRQRFCEMIYRWREAIQVDPASAPLDGQTIADRWRSSGRHLKPRKMATVAVQADPPIVDEAGHPANLQPGQPATGPQADAQPAQPATGPQADAQPAQPANVQPVQPADTPAEQITNGQSGQPTNIPQTIPTPHVQSPLAELSPWFVCQGDFNMDKQLSPTKGQAAFIAADLGEPWKFADVVFQREPEARNALAPTTSINLFVRSDEHGRIEEQIAVKTLEVNELAKLDQEADKEAANARVEQEVGIHRLIGSTNCSHVNRYRGHGIRETKTHLIMPGQTESQIHHRKTVHLYEDFSGHGDLQQLVARHSEKGVPINEHFIWYTLRELTEALVALNKGPGHCSKPHEPATKIPASEKYKPMSVDPWVPILHLDIKLDNVFLEYNSTDYPAYPKPVLADFGVSCRGTAENIDPKHSNVILNAPRFAGTEGWHPPERYAKVVRDKPEDYIPVGDWDYLPYNWRLSEKSDIWALGLIAHRMMYSHRTDTVEDQGPNQEISVGAYTLSKESTWPDILTEGKIRAHDSHFNVLTAEISHLPDAYSARLCILVAQCLRHDIDARPTLEQLLRTCQKELSRLDGLSSSAPGKRKREDDSDSDATLLADDVTRNNKFNRYRIGEIYQPKRPRTMVDLDEDGPVREEYHRLVDRWSNLPRPTSTDQAAVINEINAHFLNVEDLQDLVGVAEDDEYGFPAYEWAVKHLISCLRKRCDPKSGIYILTESYMQRNDGNDWVEVERAFEPKIKIKILDHLLTLLNDTWEEEYSGKSEGSRNALEALRNAVGWGVLMLNTGTSGRDDPVEPRNPRLEDQSALHQGIYDWIFVKPTGAFFKG